MPDDAGGWIVWGEYRADTFDRLEDGTYVCAGWEGLPLYIRCVAQDGDVLTVLDGGGYRFTYRIVALPVAP